MKHLSPTIKCFALAAVSFFCLSAIAGQLLAAAPKGLVIYSETSGYTQCCEYSSLVSRPTYSTILRSDGQSFQLKRDAALTVVDYPTLNPQPNPQETVTSNLEKIQGL